MMGDGVTREEKHDQMMRSIEHKLANLDAAWKLVLAEVKADLIDISEGILDEEGSDPEGLDV